MPERDPTTSVADPDQAGEPAGASDQAEAPTRCVLPSQAADSTIGREIVRLVRAFAMTGVDADERLVVPGKGVLPALMHAMRDTDRVRTGEPLVLAHAGDGVGVRTFGDWLAGAIDAAFGAGEARELRDNASRVERAARRVALSSDRPGSLRVLVERAVDDVVTELRLKADTAKAMREGARVLSATLDEADTFVAFGDDAPLAVLVHLAGRTHARAYESFRDKARTLRDRLDHKLKQDSARGGKGVTDTLAGPASAAAMDPAALARVLGKPRGPRGMSDERRARLEKLCAQLDAFLHEPAPIPAIVVGPDSTRVPGPHECVPSALPCEAGARRYDALADHRLPLFLAVRVAELEADDRYDPAVQGVYIESFGRDGLSPDEVGVLPVVIAVESLERLAGADMANVARLLLSGRPVRVLLACEPASSFAPDADHDPLLGSRFEPGMFAVGLRAPIVHQSSPAATAHLVDGFERALRASRPSLHVIASGVCEGGAEPTVGRWMHAGAAADARAHPLFFYDPSPGASWADRFDFGANEQPERDWPEHELDAVDAGGVERPQQLAFTFADFAVLEPAYRRHLRLIPDECPTADLAPVGEVLASPREGDRRVPFVWVADPDGRLHRAAVARRLIDACHDRAECWRTLQQCAGIHDAYAERAAEAERRRASEDADERIAHLKAEHAAELDRVRREEAGQAFERLAQAIVGIDPAALSAAPARGAPKAPASTGTPAAPAESSAPESPAPAAEVDDDLGFDEPYIDSILCTSCNDCINLNPRLFTYNANKQAQIGDPSAGKFVELVTAAEKCPARCIHPGKPRDPNEPGLDELVERAKPFN